MINSTQVTDLINLAFINYVARFLQEVEISKVLNNSNKIRKVPTIFIYVQQTDNS